MKRAVLRRWGAVAVAATLTGLWGSVAGGCGRSMNIEQLSDEERRERIDELYAGYQSEFTDANEITVDELVQLREGGDVVVVDVREPEEVAVSRIPGAITLDEFDRRRDEHRDKKIVAYCTIGARSGECAQDLASDGFDAYNLKGSILSWTHAGQPLVDAEGRGTNRVHVYGKKWALAPQSYESVY